MNVTCPECGTIFVLEVTHTETVTHPRLINDVCPTCDVYLGVQLAWVGDQVAAVAVFVEEEP